MGQGTQTRVLRSATRPYVRRRSVAALAVASLLLSVEGVNAGFTSGGYVGGPIGKDSAEEKKLNAAIKNLRDNGRGRQADQLAALLRIGGICIDVGNKGDCAAALIGSGVSSPFGAKINVSKEYLLAAPAEFVAALLVHELSHTQSTLGAVTDKTPEGRTIRAIDECYASWEEYVYLIKARGGTSEGSTARSWVDTAIADILRRYPLFATVPTPRSGTPPQMLPQGFDAQTPEAQVAMQGWQTGANALTHYASYGSGTMQVHSIIVSPPGTVTFTVATMFTAVTSQYHYVTSGGTNVVLICGVDSSSGSGGVQVLVDTDADTIADSIGTVVPFGSGLISPTSIVAVPKLVGEHHLFVFDNATKQVFSLSDFDHDGIPDDLGAVFASAGAFPELEDARFLRVTGAIGEGPVALGDTFVAASGSSVGDDSIARDFFWIELHDANDDGIADGSTGKRFGAVDLEFAPRLWSGASPGRRDVLVHGVSGHLIEVLGRSEHGTGTFDVVLGSATVVPGGVDLPGLAAFELASVILARPLRGNEEILLRDTAIEESTPGAPIPVRPPTARVLAVFPSEGPGTGGTVVTISGEHLHPDSRVILGDDDQDPVEASVVSASQSRIVIMTPFRGVDAYHSLPIRVVAPGRDAREAEGGFYFRYASE